MKVMRDRLGKLKPRLATTRQVRDKRYSADAEVRGWYKSARWQDLRQQVLLRDLYTCQQTGVLLAGRAPAGNSSVVDHKVPHRGDETLFWDIANLQAVSKAYHDSIKQKEDRADGYE